MGVDRRRLPEPEEKSMKPRVLTIGALFAAGMAAALPASAAEAPDTSARAAVMFWLIDRNGDGTIDQGEITALRAVIFDAIDVNHDGRLTKDEVKTLAEAGRARIADHIATIIKEGPAKIAERRAKIAERLGLDTPGGLAKADFVDRKAAIFSRADSDGNGSLSKSEFEAAAGNLRQMMMPE
jgi:Ca2+-binding EF-hand superfamily protein